MIKKILGHLPASTRFAMSERQKRLKALLGTCALWNYIVCKVDWSRISSAGFWFIGRKAHLDLAGVIFSQSQSDSNEPIPHSGSGRVIISELPFPGSHCIPHYLSTIIPLDKPLEELFPAIDKDRYRLYRKQREHFMLKGITDPNEIKRLQNEMFEPYAKDRYGDAVAQLTDDDAKKMANATGALHVLCRGDEEVGCHIGSAFEFKKKRYWSGVRSGYPPHIYADSKTFSSTNTMNVFMEIEWVKQQGYDFYDIGITLSNPDNGVLQWKRKHRGFLSLIENYDYFYIKPPRGSEPEFFWETPLISVKRGQLILHLGWPASQDEDAVLSRYKQMGFDGLAKVNLYTQMQPSDVMLEKLLYLYRYANTKPTINICH